MIRLLLSLVFGFTCLYSHGQEKHERSLHYYIETAKENSPLIKDYANQTLIQQAELQRLKAMYMHSRLELNGDYLFVPIISKDGGHTAFKWNAQDATDYYGYDLGESSGYFHAGVTWTQPLLGKSSYKAAREQAMINEDLANNHIRVEKHQLERFVTEHYLLCLLDKIQIHFADSVASLLEKQIRTVQKLSENGMAKQSDVRLLLIEQQSNAETRTAFRQSYHTHLMDLNLLCGIDNTDDVALTEECLSVLSHPVGERSLFSEQYRLDSLNVAASLHSFNLQYKPRLDLFVNGGMQTGDFAGWYRHFGWSAGIIFSWTIFDGRQKRWKERQVQLQQSSIQNYKSHAEYQRGMRISQCLSELAGYGERGKSLNKQLSEYEHVLSGYEKEMQAGQVSVLDYITVLRNKIQTERDYLLLQTNRQLVIAAYNYWNW